METQRQHVRTGDPAVRRQMILNSLRNTPRSTKESALPAILGGLSVAAQPEYDAGSGDYIPVPQIGGQGILPQILRFGTNLYNRSNQQDDRALLQEELPRYNQMLLEGNVDPSEFTHATLRRKALESQIERRSNVNRLQDIHDNPSGGPSGVSALDYRNFDQDQRQLLHQQRHGIPDLHAAQTTAIGQARLDQLPQEREINLGFSQREAAANAARNFGYAEALNQSRSEQTRSDLESKAILELNVAAKHEQRKLDNLGRMAKEERRVELEKIKPVTIQVLQKQVDENKFMDNIVGDARELATTSAINGFASLTNSVPGTDAHSLYLLLVTLQGKAALGTIVDHKSIGNGGSPFGATSDQEIALLKAAWGNLEQTENKETFIKRLNGYQKVYHQSMQRKLNNYKRLYGEEFGVTPTETPLLSPDGGLIDQDDRQNKINDIMSRALSDG